MVCLRRGGSGTARRRSREPPALFQRTARDAYMRPLRKTAARPVGEAPRGASHAYTRPTRGIGDDAPRLVFVVIHGVNPDKAEGLRNPGFWVHPHKNGRFSNCGAFPGRRCPYGYETGTFIHSDNHGGLSLRRRNRRPSVIAERNGTHTCAPPVELAMTRPALKTGGSRIVGRPRRGDAPTGSVARPDCGAATTRSDAAASPAAVFSGALDARKKFP